jgi:SAM-dependent methyltransferase
MTTETAHFEWIDEQDRTDRMLVPFGTRMLQRASLVPGERVLDIGCGTGATTVDAWRSVAPSGSVIGVDISPMMLSAARARACAAPDANIRAPQRAPDFATEHRLRALLETAGFQVTALERYSNGLWVGSSAADVLAWFARLSEGRMLEALNEAQKHRLLGSLEAELTSRTTPDGVYLGGTAWIVECAAPWPCLAAACA